ncbi:SLATT domain-containing protein [Pararhodobacter sp.]|uniref:SLATT domain-containing protein n=1 Tax=Pararhodobacter sp. TaxID=2127056 RepID=UPI002FDC7D95
MSIEKTEGIGAAAWITSKSRMYAEKRLRLYDWVAHLLLSWLSLSVIAWSVVRSSVENGVLIDLYTAILSVFVFAFSVIVFGFKFGENAAQHRECYLRLQKLLDSGASLDEFTQQYHEILAGYGNHGSWDYESVVLSLTLLNKREGQERAMQGKDGSSIVWSWPMLLKHVVFGLIFWLACAAIFVLGLYTFILIFLQVS